jgi:glycosyltransferase involved in cell wall biosynthesis
VNILVIAKDFPTREQPNAGIFVLRQAQALADLGHRLLVVRVVPKAPSWSEKWRSYRATPAEDCIEGIPVKTLRAFMPPRLLGLEYLPLQVDRALGRIASAFGADIIHGHFLLPSGQLAVRQGLPSVVTAHGSDAYDWALRRRGLRRAASEGIRGAGAVVAVSDFIRRHVRDIYDRDVAVIFNGADDRVFGPRSKTEARTALGIAEDRFVIAYAGRLSQAKGAFDLIQACTRLRDIAPLVLCAGAGPEEQAVRHAVAERAVDVRFCGLLDHEDLAQAFAAADVFCLPSYREGLPVVVCEAMLSGRPIVATQVGGIPEIVAEGVHGYLVKPGDAESLADRLRAIASDRSQAERMGATAHAFASERLTWSANALSYERLFERVCDGAA